MNNRVAITGMGAICGLGHNLQEVWDNCINGVSGITKIEESEVSTLAVQIAGEVKNFKLSPDIISEKEAQRYDRFIHFASHAADEAFKMAAIKDTDYAAHKMGCILGVGMGGIPEVEKSHARFVEKGARRISPFFIPAIIPNMSSGIITIKYGMKGVNYTVASACASAAHALSNSCFEIMSGRQDLVISGGAESVLSNLPMGGFINMKALSKKFESPELASRPFDKDRNGFVIGEGAGILVLENLEKAKARGATIYAEIVGHGATSDAFHITAPEPNGEGAARCMAMCLESSGIDLTEVDYINAHGTSTPLGDKGETLAIKATFGKHAQNLSISSTKSMTGHLLGAAGGIESIFCAMALHTGIIPPTINLKTSDEDCDLNYVPNKMLKKEIKYALNNSFGFGGTNSSMLLKRYS